FLREWLCSYSEKISLKDSAGSLAGVDSGAAGSAALGSDRFGLEVSGLDMKRLKPCGVIPIRIPPARRDPEAGRNWLVPPGPGTADAQLFRTRLRLQRMRLADGQFLGVFRQFQNPRHEVHQPPLIAERRFPSQGDVADGRTDERRLQGRGRNVALQP